MLKLIVVIVVALLMVLLAAAIAYVYGMWTSLADADMPIGLYFAMAGGVILSFAVGIGLMSLVFSSNRRGRDDRAAGPDQPE